MYFSVLITWYCTQLLQSNRILLSSKKILVTSTHNFIVSIPSCWTSKGLPSTPHLWKSPQLASKPQLMPEVKHCIRPHFVRIRPKTIVCVSSAWTLRIRCWKSLPFCMTLSEYLGLVIFLQEKSLVKLLPHANILIKRISDSLSKSTIYPILK